MKMNLNVALVISAVTFNGLVACAAAKEDEGRLSPRTMLTKNWSSFSGAQQDKLLLLTQRDEGNFPKFYEMFTLFNDAMKGGNFAVYQKDKLTSLSVCQDPDFERFKKFHNMFQIFNAAEKTKNFKEREIGELRLITCSSNPDFEKFHRLVGMFQTLNDAGKSGFPGWQVEKLRLIAYSSNPDYRAFSEEWEKMRTSK